MKREISKKNWLMSFYRWFNLAMVDKTGGKYKPKKQYESGYCVDVGHFNCTRCLINPDICDDCGGAGMFDRWSRLHFIDYKRAFKHSLHTFNYVVNEGRRLGYMTPSLECKYEKVIKG